jgi:SRSO17 transposase
VRIIKVDRTKWEELWDEMVKEHHYLGYDKTIGARIKYLIMLGEQLVGAISFSAAVKHLKPRDEYIGWNEEEKETGLNHLVNNNRFLILSWIQIRNLASCALSKSVKQLRKDWKKQYGNDLYMVETFVDGGQYHGTCYKAANWINIGQTKGYGKQGKTFTYHGNPKEIFVYFMNRQFIKSIRPRAPLPSKREEMLKMIGPTHPAWSPFILPHSGITTEYITDMNSMLIDYTEEYTSCFKRSESQENMLVMLKGLMSDLTRKSIEPIAMAYKGVAGVRAVQLFMQKSKWNEDQMFKIYHDSLSALISDEGGMITVDGTDFPKKGNDSAGVSRQYCGRLGKVDNCQASVMAGYVSPKGYGLLSRKLYIPEKWFGDEYADKRTKCGIPADMKFETKTNIAAAMIKGIVSDGKFKAKWVGADSSFGNVPDFLDSIPEGIYYFADIHCSQRVFVDMPTVSRHDNQSSVGIADKKQVTVTELVADDGIPWNDVVLGEGSKGPIFSKEKCFRVVEVRNKLPSKEVWLYVRQLADKSIKYALCNAPVDTPIETLRRLALMRWSIEICFRECKDILGMDHNESRSYTGWNRHVLLTFIAHLFLLRIILRFKTNLPYNSKSLVTPVTLEEYAQKYAMGVLDIFAEPGMAVPFLTADSVRTLINHAIPKSGQVIDIVDANIRNYYDSYTSHKNCNLIANGIG